MKIEEKELKSTRDAYGEVLLEIGENFKDVFVLDADLSRSTKTYLFSKKFPERFYNVGIAEQNMMGIAAGLSKTDKIVIASTLAIFATGRAYDQIRNTIAHSNCNVKIIATHGGISVGRDGSSHQSLEDIALMRVIPGMRVIVPCDATETKKAILKCLEIEGPFYIRLGRENTPVIFNQDYNFVLGKGHKIKNGKDVSFIGCGMMVYELIKAANILLKDNIDAEIINISSIKPIDSEIIKTTALKTGKVFTFEEHNIIGGLGSAVLEVLEAEKDIYIKRIGMEDCFGESGKPSELFDKYGLSAEKISEKVKSIIG